MPSNELRGGRSPKFGHAPVTAKGGQNWPSNIWRMGGRQTSEGGSTGPVQHFGRKCAGVAKVRRGVSGPRPTHVRRSSVFGTSRSRREGGSGASVEHLAQGWWRENGPVARKRRGVRQERPTSNTEGVPNLGDGVQSAKGGPFGACPTLSPPPFAYLPRESRCALTGG